jgi:hypothetical protein
MNWRTLRERITQLFQDSVGPLFVSVPKPDPSASNDVIDEYFTRSGEQARENLRQLGIKNELLEIRVMQAMIWDVVPPEQHDELAERIQEMRRDHYRLSPSEFRAKYREYIDDADVPQE